MIDLRAAQVRTHRRNIQRYSRLLATELTVLERQYMHKRIAEEYAQLERLEPSHEEAQKDLVMTAGFAAAHDIASAAPRDQISNSHAHSAVRAAHVKTAG